MRLSWPSSNAWNARPAWSAWSLAIVVAGLVAGAPTHAMAQDADHGDGDGDAIDDRAPGAGMVHSSASGALGAGMIDAQAATALDLGLDVAGEHYAMGLGLRLRWLLSDRPDGGFRHADWDERSEWASLLRYLSYARDHGEVHVGLAMGELGGLTLGHGSLLDGYSAGLDIDHRHLGAELAISGHRLGGSALIDDLVAPRIVGARAGWRTPGERFSFSAHASSAADLSAPTSGATNAPAMDSSAFLPLFALDGRAEMTSADGRFGGALHLDLVAISTMAAGVHAGLSGHARVLGQTRVWLRAEVRAGTDRYIPGWFGPLYELNRRAQGMGPEMPMSQMESQLDVARRGGLRGFGALFETRVAVPTIGDFSIYYARRKGLADHVVARASVPFLRDVQGAAWLAAEVGDGAEAWIVASEIRVRIHAGWFASAEFSRLYREENGVLAPIYTGMMTAGMTVDL